MKVCMLSSVHSADDIRIFEKEARSLAAFGHQVTVVARPPAAADAPGIDFRLLDLPSVPRWKRPWIAGRKATAQARLTTPDVVQFHDPELIPFALGLKHSGCKVIYDVHEDLPRDIMSKTWIPRLLRPLVAAAATVIERFAAAKFDAIVAATPSIGDRFRSYGANVITVRNTVRPDEFGRILPIASRRVQAVYVGRISFDRGLVEMVEACGLAGLPLVLAGAAGPAEKEWMAEQPHFIDWRGKLGRSEIAALLTESLVGLHFLRSEPNYMTGISTKILEYMAAGLPVVTSDLPMSRQIVEQAGCGFVVPMGNIRHLADVIRAIVSDRDLATRMGAAGRAAAIKTYNWETDAAVLNELYLKL